MLVESEVKKVYKGAINNLVENLYVTFSFKKPFFSRFITQLNNLADD